MGSDTEDVASTYSGILINTETMVSEARGPRFVAMVFHDLTQCPQVLTDS